MTPIQMVDLRKQYLQIKPQVDKAVIDVLESTAFINGKPVQEFAASLSAYLGVKHMIPCANGTDALQIAMMALDLQPGDEIITPSFTYIATTEVIALLKLTPVFVDVDKATFCIDPELISKAITPKTKAIVPVHMFGQTANMEEIMRIAKEHNLYVIEDNAQAIGADYFFSDGSTKKAGSIGTIGATSFFPSKNLGCFGDGGAIFTNDDVLGEKLKMIANHGQRVRYYHDMVGCNSRLDTLQAAILKIKLPLLDKYIAARQSLAAKYTKAFAGNPHIKTPEIAAHGSHVFHQYTMVLEGVDRNGLNAFLAEKGIPSMIYYPVPAHRQKMFANSSQHNVNLTVTDWLTERVLSLPMHTEMEDDQLEFITSNVLAYIK